jgi:hypothetical protein
MLPPGLFVTVFVILWIIKYFCFQVKYHSRRGVMQHKICLLLFYLVTEHIKLFLR